MLCLSGGLDSTALALHFLAQNQRVFGVSFDYGQSHRLELERLQANLVLWRERNRGLADWTLIDLRSINRLLRSALTDPDIPMPFGHYADASMRATFVPNRNALFAAVAYGYALSLSERLDQSVGLGLGVHAGDHAIYPDCRPAFYDALWQAFRIGNWNSERIELRLPYLNWSKSDILRDARRSCERLGLDFEAVFRNTCTSYLPDATGRAQGLTGSDVERILAFHRLGWVDPLEYQQPWDEVVRQALEAERRHRESDRS